MDERTGVSARPIRKARPDTRLPARLIEVDTEQVKLDDGVGQPHRLSSGTRLALVHSARHKARTDAAEAKASGHCLTKSTFGAVTTYEYIGSGPPRPLLQVVDESYYRSQAKAPASSSSSRNQEKAT